MTSTKILVDSAYRTVKVPTRVLAGVTIPDTPVVTKAMLHAKATLSPVMYNHTMRSLLASFLIGDGHEFLNDRDIELQAVAMSLHALGWVQTKGLMSEDKVFQVDGANAAIEFFETLGEEMDDGWGVSRSQLLWDCIALQFTKEIAMWKEAEVAACAMGVNADFYADPTKHFNGVFANGEWGVILKEFPKDGFKEEFKEAMCELCRQKGLTTFQLNPPAAYGKRYVAGYPMSTLMDEAMDHKWVQMDADAA